MKGDRCEGVDSWDGVLVLLKGKVLKMEVILVLSFEEFIVKVLYVSDVLVFFK